MPYKSNNILRNITIVIAICGVLWFFLAEQEPSIRYVEGVGQVLTVKAMIDHLGEFPTITGEKYVGHTFNVSGVVQKKNRAIELLHKPPSISVEGENGNVIFCEMDSWELVSNVKEGRYVIISGVLTSPSFGVTLSHCSVRLMKMKFWP